MFCFCPFRCVFWWSSLSIVFVCRLHHHLFDWQRVFRKEITAGHAHTSFLGPDWLTHFLSSSWLVKGSRTGTDYFLWWRFFFVVLAFFIIFKFDFFFFEGDFSRCFKLDILYIWKWSGLPNFILNASKIMQTNFRMHPQQPETNFILKNMGVVRVYFFSMEWTISCKLPCD